MERRVAVLNDDFSSTESPEDDLDSHTENANEDIVPAEIVGRSNNTEPTNTYIRYNSARSDVVTENPSDNNSMAGATNQTSDNEDNFVRNCYNESQVKDGAAMDLMTQERRHFRQVGRDHL